MNASLVEQEIEASLDISTCLSVQKPPGTQICRICLDSQETLETGDILQPCLCKGSIGSVHSNCLKRAIALMVKNFDNGCRCEICGEEYKMEISIRYRLAWRNLRNKQLDSFVALLFFAILGAAVFLRISGVFQMLGEVKSLLTDKSTIFSFGISLSIFFFALIIYIRPIIYLIRETFGKFESNWRIYNYFEVVKKDPKLKSKISKVLSEMSYNSTI